MRTTKPTFRTSPSGGRWRRSASLVVIGAALATGCGGSDDDGTDAQADAITIRYTSVGATGSEIMDQVEWFAEQVEERTDGRVQFELFFDGSLVGAGDTLAAVQDGRADAGYLCDCYAPNEFPLWSLFSMPFSGNNAEAIMHTAWEMYDSGGPLADEFDRAGVHANWFHTIGAGLTYMREPIESVDDLAGKRLRAIGLTAQAFEGAGAQAVAMDPGEIYESVQRGAIDGVGTFFLPTAHAFGIHEVAPHIADPGTGYYASIGFLMNKDVWESLPDDVQQVFDEVSEELMSGVAIDIYEAASAEACQAFLDAGGSVVVFDDDEVQAWRDEVLPEMVEDWTQTAVQRSGLSEAEVEEFRATFLETLDRQVAASDHVPDAEACAAQQ